VIDCVYSDVYVPAELVDRAEQVFTGFFLPHSAADSVCVGRFAYWGVQQVREQIQTERERHEKSGRRRVDRGKKGFVESNSRESWIGWVWSIEQIF
jgi:hypothetical protein